MFLVWGAARSVGRQWTWQVSESGERELSVQWGISYRGSTDMIWVRQDWKTMERAYSRDNGGARYNIVKIFREEAGVRENREQQCSRGVLLDKADVSRVEACKR